MGTCSNTRAARSCPTPPLIGETAIACWPCSGPRATTSTNCSRSPQRILWTSSSRSPIPARGNSKGGVCAAFIPDALGDHHWTHRRSERLFNLPSDPGTLSAERQEPGRHRGDDQRQLAEHRDELGKTSMFQVLSQKQVAQAIPNYPQLVKGPYKSAYFEIDVDYANTDLVRVKELQQHLGVDYVYVLWAPATVSHGNSSWFSKHYLVTQIVAQLFESPGGKEVGRGQYAVRVDDQTHQVLSDDMRRVALEMAEKTHTLK